MRLYSTTVKLVHVPERTFIHFFPREVIFEVIVEFNKV